MKDNIKHELLQVTTENSSVSWVSTNKSNPWNMHSYMHSSGHKKGKTYFIHIPKRKSNI